MRRCVLIAFAALMLVGCRDSGIPFRDKCASKGGHTYSVPIGVNHIDMCLSPDGRVIEVY